MWYKISFVEGFVTMSPKTKQLSNSIYQLTRSDFSNDPVSYIEKL